MMVLIVSTALLLLTLLVAASIVQWSNDLRSARDRRLYEVGVLTCEWTTRLAQERQQYRKALDDKHVWLKAEAKRIGEEIGRRLGVELSEARVEDFRRQMVSFQMRAESIMRSMYDRNPYDGRSSPSFFDKLVRWYEIKEARGDAPILMAAHASPVRWLDPGQAFVPSGLRERMLRIQPVRFQFSLGLSEDVPPEFIVGEMVERVRVSILKQFQSQSILNHETLR